MSRTKGIEGEDLADEILTDLGYKILTRNFRSRFGEIDIIAKKNQALIFIEVKYRKNAGFGLPQEAVNKKKIRKILKTAEIYRETTGIETGDWRVDLITINPDNKTFDIFENIITLGMN